MYFFCGVGQSHNKPEGLLSTLIHQPLTTHYTDEMMFAAAHRWKETTPVAKLSRVTLMKLLQELLSLGGSQVL